jgi:hypothetical protein
MTSKDEFIEHLEAYLDEYEGVTPLPDAVRDAIRAELPHAKQIGPLGGPSRFLSMTLQLPAAARYGLAAVAVLVAVVIGASILSRGGSVGGPGDSPSPSPTPTATGPINLVEAPLPDNLPAGDYYLDLPAYPARIEFDLPAGWWHFYDGPLREDATAHAILVLDTMGRNGSAWGLGFTLVDEVLVDPCDPAAGNMEASVTESAEALADAFSSWEAFPASSVEDVTLSGFSGKRVDVTVEGDAPCEAALFNTPSGYAFGPIWPSSGPKVNQFTLLDVEGSVLVIWTTDFPATTEFEVAGGAVPDPDAHVEDQEQLHDILDSIVLEAR